MSGKDEQVQTGSCGLEHFLICQHWWCKENIGTFIVNVLTFPFIVSTLLVRWQEGHHPFIASTLVIRWQEGHLTCKWTCFSTQSFSLRGLWRPSLTQNDLWKIGLLNKNRKLRQSLNVYNSISLRTSCSIMNPQYDHSSSQTQMPNWHTDKTHHQLLPAVHTCWQRVQQLIDPMSCSHLLTKGATINRPLIQCQ